MRRNIADRINQFQEELKAHNQVGDENLLIVKSCFNTNLPLSEYETMVLQKDITDDGFEVTPAYIIGTSYSRKPYITASLDLFNTIRELSKKAYILFVYIINNVELNSNKIILDVKTVKKVISEKYDSNARNIIAELVKHKLIGKVESTTIKNCYCINHIEYFRGSYSSFIYKHNKLYNKDNGESDNRQDAND